MSNSCLIAPAQGNLGILLRWSGDFLSVYGFLEYCKLKQYPGISGNSASNGEGLARLVQVISNCHPTRSISIQDIESFPNSQVDLLDNGVFIVDGLDIISNIHGEKQTIYTGAIHYNNEELVSLLEEIDKYQPKETQLGSDFLRAVEVNMSDLKTGDIVYCFDTIYHKYTEQRVVGFTICAGYDTKPHPYVDKYPNSSDGVNFNNILVGPVRKKFTEDRK